MIHAKRRRRACMCLKIPAEKYSSMSIYFFTSFDTHRKFPFSICKLLELQLLLLIIIPKRQN